MTDAEIQKSGFSSSAYDAWNWGLNSAVHIVSFPLPAQMQPTSSCPGDPTERRERRHKYRCY